MQETLNWDEFRIVKAIADTHSLAGAGERLGLNHSTMFRRLTAIETKLGVRLFERERSGYRTTPAGEDMVALATLMGETIAEFEQRVAGNDVKLSGLLRLATSDAIGSLVMPAIVADFRRAHPGLHLDLIFSESSLDHLRRDADVALCVLRTPLAEGFEGRRVAALPWAIYATLALIPSGDEARLASAPWVLPLENIGPPQAHRWLARRVEPTRRVARAHSFLAMAELAARSVGAALLPCLIGVTKPNLRVVAKADPELDGEVWLVARPQALRTPRVRALFDFVGDELERRRAWFAGEARFEA